ncbi:acetyl-CoA carboxylase biotin carboxylase subunit [uncultured Roseovarius sp.]|uniref:acetyl-CoA carboxylase biotin carboxylase subunit n=1 Tax=uncultured Roseovarius sp. TaxID=293344 RepID=UPI0026123374|nr:acetyl-CoA carboxylase biotin carboxylase subunit [uncultured Roseovarius sp.]
MKKVLIANRGEIALRAVRACNALGIRSVAVFAAPDAASPHVWAASEAVCIGPAPSSQSYLNVDALLHVACATGCDAIYPGYGFLAENADFAERCAAEGLIFIGPEAQTIRLMGDKAAARATAIKFGVPVVRGSDGVVDDPTQVEHLLDDMGFPVLIKASAGGGGRGMRIARSRSEFAALFSQASREAQQAFGDASVYLERFISNVRHIEVQVFGDGKGQAVHVGERDCTVQRRHQKLLEEAPSPILTATERAHIQDSALRLAAGVNYRGAGTVEFIFDADTREYFFIEMNTRIQVEHPVSEMLTGADLVAEQFRIACGEALSVGPPPADCGHAIEFRINAESFRHDFRPSPGRITKWEPPRGPGIRVDGFVATGSTVQPYYDSMLAKLIVHGTDRAHALSRARAALAAFKVEGIDTTIDLHRALVHDPDFAASRIHTKWVEERFLPQVFEGEK